MSPSEDQPWKRLYVLYDARCGLCSLGQAMAGPAARAHPPELHPGRVGPGRAALPRRLAGRASRSRSWWSSATRGPSTATAAPGSCACTRWRSTATGPTGWRTRSSGPWPGRVRPALARAVADLTLAEPGQRGRDRRDAPPGQRPGLRPRSGTDPAGNTPGIEAWPGIETGPSGRHDDTLQETS